MFKTQNLREDINKAFGFKVDGVSSLGDLKDVIESMKREKDVHDLEMDIIMKEDEAEKTIQRLHDREAIRAQQFYEQERVQRDEYMDRRYEQEQARQYQRVKDQEDRIRAAAKNLSAKKRSVCLARSEVS